MMKHGVDNRIERLVREVIGRIVGRFSYTEEEAIDAIRTVLATPVKTRRDYSLKPEPWKPGEPKPGADGRE